MEKTKRLTSADNIVEYLRPDGAWSLGETQMLEVYRFLSSQSDFEKVIQAIKQALEERVLALQARGEINVRQNKGILALERAIDLAGKLLTPKEGEAWPENITFAVNFLKGNAPSSFLDELVNQISGSSVSAEVLSDESTHLKFSKKITQALRQLIRLKKLASNDFVKDTIVREKGLGVITAVDEVKEDASASLMFQRLFFDQDGLTADPDTQLAGQILFAAFLIKLSILSAQHKDEKKLNPAEFLKGELIKAIGEVGYEIDPQAFESPNASLIKIRGSEVLDSLLRDMRSSSETRKAA